MHIIYDFLVFLHFVGMAILVGGYLVTIRAPRILPAMWHGALTQVVTGLALVAFMEMDLVDKTPNHMKIGIKLLLAIAVAVLVFIGHRAERRAIPKAMATTEVAPAPSAKLATIVGPVALAAVLVAVFL